MSTIVLSSRTTGSPARNAGLLRQSPTASRRYSRLPIGATVVAQAGSLLLLAFLLAAMAPLGLSAQTTSKEAELIAVLKSDANQKAKADACRELARVGTKNAVPALAALLADEQLSHMARYALETIPDAAVDKALREALGKLTGRPLIGVIGSIGVRRDSKAVDLVAGKLQDADPEVVQAAARALGKIPTAKAAKYLQDSLSTAAAPNQLDICEGLFRCAESFAGHGKRSEAVRIYDQLRQATASHQVHAAALRGAVLNRGAAGLPALLQIVSSGGREDPALFSAAMRIAQEMPGAEVTHGLGAQLPKLTGDRQILVIQTLAKRGDAAALPAMLEAARTCEKPVRLEAVRACGQLGDDRAAPGLSDLITDRDPEIAQSAQETLASLPGKRADAAIMAMLAQSPANRRLIGIELIRRRRLASAAADLWRMADDPEVQIRTAAVKTLGELLTAVQMPMMLERLTKAKSPEDLEAVEHALGAMSLKAADTQACAPDLGSRLSGLEPAQKIAVVHVLSALGGASALKSVRAAVDDANPEVHGVAIRALGGWNSAEAAPQLLALAQSSGDVTDKKLCLRGYLNFASHSELSPTERLAMCRQAQPLIQSEDEKKLLLAALGSVSTTDSLELIQPWLDDPATKLEASTAVLDVAKKILESGEAAKSAKKLLPILNKVADVSADNAEVSKRAQALLERAREKSQ